MDIASYLVIALIKLLGLFSLSGARRFGNFVGWLLMLLRSRLYRVSQRNLLLCYPDMPATEREVLVRESLRQTGQTFAETGIAWAGTDAELRRNESFIHRVHQEELLDAALADKTGLMLITLHHGNWEWFNTYLPQRCDIAVLYKMNKMPVLEQWMLARRSRSGIKMINGTRAGVEAFTEHYCQGGTILFAPDQEPSRKSGLYVPFFGRPALTPKLPHYLIQRNPKGRVLLCFVERCAEGFDIKFMLPPAALFDADLETSATALNQGFELCINQSPAQYQWGYRRFKRRPEGMPNLYK